MSSLDVPDASGAETWASSANFVSAVQGEVNADLADSSPLDLMLVSPDAETAQESSGASEYLTLSDDFNANQPSFVGVRSIRFAARRDNHQRADDSQCGTDREFAVSVL